MAGVIETDRKGVNVDLNIVPFVDVMSCLTAFLLVTAVWINMANLRDQPAGRGRDHPDIEQEKIAVLIEADRMVVYEGAAETDLKFNDWAGLEQTLRAIHVDPRPHVEIAAESTSSHPVEYQTLIAAMDTTVKAGFPDVGVTDPASLSR